MKRYTGWNMVGIVAGSWLLGGPACTEPQKNQWNMSAMNRPAKDDGPVDSNIVRVNKFFSQAPWLCFKNDGSKRIDGVSFTVYLEGSEQPKGVFGSGTLAVIMYRLDYDPLGNEMATELKEWRMTAEEAYVWRAKKASALGWGYGMRLNWDDKIDVSGQQVAFVVKYIREDGRTISSSRQVLKVPASAATVAHKG